MINKSVLQFLEALRENNNRDWFNENKSAYTASKNEVESFIGKLIPAVGGFDKNIGSVSSKECMFRIFRDTRFSHDKTPYKTNFGGFIVNGGRKSINAGYYLHIEPQNSFLGGGVYMPSSDVLKVVRQEIYYNVDKFKEIIEESKFKKLFGQIEGEKLKKMPRDYSADFKEPELLKFKSYTILHSLDDKIISSDSFFDYVVKGFKAMHPFNQFINDAIYMLSL